MTKQSKRRLPWALVALGAAMLLAGLGMLLWTTGSALQYCVAAPDPGEKGETYRKLAVSAGHVGEELKDALEWVALGGTGEEVTLTAGKNSEAASLVAMGEGWLEVYPRFIVQGRRIGETELADGAKLIMLDEGLAFKLFGEELPPEAKVTLNEAEYRVVGTVRHAGSLLGGRGVGDGQAYDAYVPLLSAAASGVELDTLTLSAKPQDDDSGAAQLFGEAAGQWLAGGTFINLKKEAMRRTILPRIVLLIAGLYVMVGLFKRMTLLAEGWVEGFRRALKGSYLKPLIPRLVGLIALILLGYGALIGLTWLLMVFSAQPLYVFTEWVPENIVEWSSIRKVFWSLVSDSARLVRVGSRELRTIEFWGGLTRWGTVLLLLGGAMRGRRAAKE